MLNFIKQNIEVKTAAEIGVMHGYHAKAMLDMFPTLEKLYLVDCWHFEDYPIAEEGLSLEGEKKHYEIAREILAPYKNRVEFVKYISRNAVLYVPEGLDFVYIDANHRYHWVKEDFACWYPKVRKGGVVGGHDFVNTSGVTQFVSELEFPVYTKGTGGKDKYNVPVMEWWFIK